MKKNNQMKDSALYNCLKDGRQYLETWALYFLKWIEKYEDKYGIHIWGVTIQNEPLQKSKWEACLMSANVVSTFIKDHLGPLLKKHRSHVKIIIHDDQKPYLLPYAELILRDPEVEQYVSGLGVHWYAPGDWFEVLSWTHFRYPHLFILSTEATEEGGVKLLNWERGERYAHDIMGDINHFATGWIDWNIILDMEGGPNHLHNYCDALILADTENQKLHYQITYYYFGHITRFIPPNSVRIHHSVSYPSSTWYSYANDLDILTVKSPLISLENDSAQGSDQKSEYIIIVLLNRSEQEVPFSLRHQHFENPSQEEYFSYATSTIPPRSITTLRYKLPIV